MGGDPFQATVEIEVTRGLPTSNSDEYVGISKTSHSTNTEEQNCDVDVV